MDQAGARLTSDAGTVTAGIAPRANPGNPESAWRRQKSVESSFPSAPLSIGFELPISRWRSPSGPRCTPMPAGLGILAGDTARSCADLEIPVVFVTL